MMARRRVGNIPRLRVDYDPSSFSLGGISLAYRLGVGRYLMIMDTECEWGILSTSLIDFIFSFARLIPHSARIDRFNNLSSTVRSHDFNRAVSPRRDGG
jgi:hypothetical protein